MAPLILLDGDLLIAPQALKAALPVAWGQVLARRHGGSAAEWERAYRRVVEDWGSYWADLDLTAEDSLSQWREGRWRVVRALFRLCGRSAPPIKALPFYLDVLPREVGRSCAAWQPGVAEVLGVLAARGLRVGLVTPYLSSALVQGMAEAAGMDRWLEIFLGPDELGQAGLEGLRWAEVARRAGVEPAAALPVGMAGLQDVEIVPPPADLSSLPDLIDRQLEA